MEKIVVELDVKSKEGVKEVDKLNKKLSNTKKESADAGKSLDTISGGAIGKFKALKGSVGGVVKSFKSLKFAIIASGIGALLLAVLAVGKAFTSSEEGQNKFAKILGVIGAITGNLADLLADFGELIIGIFSGDSKAIKSLKSFGKFFFDTLGLPIKNTITIVKTLGKALSDLFSGDISGAFDSLTNGVVGIKDNFLDAKDAVNGATNAVKDFGAQNIKEGKAAAKVADDRAKADKIERDLIIDKAKAENEIAELRLIAKQQNKFSAKEREDALIKAGEIQDELISREGEVLKLRAEAITLENTFSRSNKENLTAEAEAMAAVIKAETARTNFKRQLARELTAAQNEQESERKAKAKAQKIIDDAEDKEAQERIKKEEEAAIKKIEKEAKTEKERLEKIAQIQDDFKKRREDELAVTTIQKLELDKERKILELEQLGADEQAKADVILFYAKKIAEENANITEKAGKQEVADAKAVAAQKEAVRQSNVNNIASAFSLLGQLAGENRALQAAAIIGESAVGIARSIVATQAANVAATATGVALAVPSGGTSIAVAAKLVAANNISAGIGIATNIAATAKGLGALKAGGAAPSSSGVKGGSTIPKPAESKPPSFNVVGQSETNQLAGAIGGQSKVPQRAYVVSGDVSTSQELDRNIIKSASI